VRVIQIALFVLLSGLVQIAQAQWDAGMHPLDRAEARGQTNCAQLSADSLLTSGGAASKTSQSNENAKNSKIMAEDDKKYVDILLHEYDTLRQEILQKNTAFLQAATVTSATFFAMFTALFALKGKRWTYILTLIPLVVFAWTAYYATHQPVSAISSRLRQLEHEINWRAGQKLLIWENEYGWGGGLYDQRTQEREKEKKEKKEKL
jgi:hypothetical protein